MDQRIKAYEGMFMLDSGTPDFQAASEPARAILTRYGAEILSLKPWDDRKLMYEIKGRKRALYSLAYFKLDTAKVVEVEHDCQLDERILRVLILRRDELTETEINAQTPATSGVRPPEIVPGGDDDRDRGEGFRRRPPMPEIEVPEEATVDIPDVKS